MTIAQSAAVAELGIAKQTSEGAAAASPEYALPVYSGLPGPTQSVQRFEVTDTANQYPGIYKHSLAWEADLTVPAFPASIGRFLKGLLPTDNVSGAGPYDHAFTPVGADSFVTLWGRRPGDLYERFIDGLIEELVIQFQNDSPLRVQARAKGKTSEVLGGAYTATTTEKYTQDGEYLTSIGGDLQLDVDGSTLASVTNIVSGTIRIMRTTDLVFTAEGVTPGVISRGRYEVGVALDTVWQDYDAYRATYYGGVAGSTNSASVVMGSTSFTFACQNSATSQLVIAVPNVALLVPEPPTADPSGAPLKVGIDGMAVTPAAGSIITADLTNDVTPAY